MMALRRSLSMLLGRRPPAMQVGAICRCNQTGKVALITSRGTGRWVIPKGWPMEGKSLPGAAATEAWEEAGITGIIGQTEIGCYAYEKAHDRGYSIQVEVRVFLMETLELADEFPEATQRKRRWFTPVEAATMVAEPGLKRILLALPLAPG